MLTGLLFLGFFGLALAGVPLMYSLLGATVGAIVIAGLTHPLETIFLSFIGGVEPFILIAVPLFIFAGEILSSGGVGKRIVAFARALLGFLPGGLGVGGILSGADAKEKIDAGATLIQIYTGLIYRGPDLVAECARALAAPLVSVPARPPEGH